MPSTAVTIKPVKVTIVYDDSINGLTQPWGRRLRTLAQAQQFVIASSHSLDLVAA